MKNWILVLVVMLTTLLTSSCGFSTNNENNGESIEEQHSEITTKDERIKYNTSSVVSGCVALFDTNRQKRCYMSHDDYYSIKDPSMNGNLKEEYSYLVALGMVLKYSGANIIWGFDGVGSVSWKDANEYVNSYSPDGAKWRLLSKIEASAIDTNIYNFTNNFGSYYPNDLSYLGSYRDINNWTSAKSDEVWVRNADGLSYNKIYTLDIYGDKCKIQREFTTYEEDLHNVYPISSL